MTTLARGEELVLDTTKTTKERQQHRPATTPQKVPVLDIRTILVTPELAKKWIDSNTPENRTVRWGRVKAYARDMKAGRWMLTGETIKLDENEVLIDGQHRLYGVMEADTAVYMVVAFNLPHEVMGALDSGISRTFGDKLKGVSDKHRNQIAAVVRKIVSWDKGNRLGKSDPPTHTELMEYFNQDPAGFTAATLHGMDVYAQRICGAAAAGTAFYLFARINTEQALQFFDQLKTGANLPEKDPVLAVRNRLSRSKTARREDKLTPEDQLALLIRAWNAFREHRTLERILIVKGGLTSRNFPVPV
jgi:hypothetical protein